MTFKEQTIMADTHAVSTTGTPTRPVGTEQPFDDVRAAVLDVFRGHLTTNAFTPFFTTDAADVLWDAYLDGFCGVRPAGLSAEAWRQQHTCHACRKFIETYGALAVIGDDGELEPVFWDVDAVPELYLAPISNMARAVRRARVTGVFVSDAGTWGTPITGQWHHFGVSEPKLRYRCHIPQGKTAYQAAAQKREDFATVSRAIAEFSLAALDKAVELLKTDALYRSEHVLGQAQWLRDLSARCVELCASRRANLVWRTIATAPDGFCHPRASMIGTLLDDLEAGLPYETVARKFAEKMHPLQYQRPTAAPSAGAIAAAEKRVAELNVAGALARRYARLEDIEAIWRPPAVEPKDTPGGIFSGLKAKTAAPTVLARTPAQTLTWEKFARTVLPMTEEIKILTPQHGPYCGLVTAVNMDAPPILQWDSVERRNPVSWYFWASGSTAASFNLPARTYVPVTAITLLPSMWQPGFEHHGVGAMFVIANCRDTRPCSLVLFPEILKGEFREIRSVIEAYSRTKDLEGQAEATACGLMFKEKKWNATVRVRAGSSWLEYRIDRWD